MMARTLKSERRLLGALLLVLLPACTSGQPSAKEALEKANAEEPAAKKTDDGDKPKKDLSATLPEPTAEELAAWDRKDPEGEKHLYKWDKANAKKMQGYWKDLQCFRERVKAEGEKAAGAEPGSTEQQQWEQFKAAYIPHYDGWQQRLFAAEGQEILTKSKYISNILEAHELVMNGYPTAYNDGDAMEIKRQDALWTVVENKVYDYSEKIGAKMDKPDLEDPKVKEKWDKYCAEAHKPPKKKK